MSELRPCVAGQDADRVVVIAASSRADQLDAALRRPGRLDTEVEIGVPSPAQRLDIFRYCFGAAGLNPAAFSAGGMSRWNRPWCCMA